MIVQALLGVLLDIRGSCRALKSLAGVTLLVAHDFHILIAVARLACNAALGVLDLASNSVTRTFSCRQLPCVLQQVLTPRGHQAAADDFVLAILVLLDQNGELLGFARCFQLSRRLFLGH